MTPLERELVDLGDHLDHGDGAGLAEAVAGRLGERRAPSPWLKVAAAVLVAVVVVAALPPSRRAIARWFGIGAVEIRPVPSTAPGASPSVGAAPVPGAAPTTGGTTTGEPPPSTARQAPTTVAPGDADIDAARARASFAILVPGSEWGSVREVDVDDRVPGSLVALTYERFTLVELAGRLAAFPLVAKLAPPGTTVTMIEVGGRPAAWVQGAHEIGYLDADGDVQRDTVRRSGSVLILDVDGTTVRIEGFEDRDDAVRVAESLR